MLFLHGTCTNNSATRSLIFEIITEDKKCFGAFDLMLLSKQNDQTIFILVVLLFPTHKDELSYIIFSKIFVTLMF